MRSVFFSCLIAAACAGVALAAPQSGHTPSKYSVEVKGYMSSVGGTPLDATLTFSHAVQLPRIKLPAGSYVFTLISPSTMRVMTEDRSRILTTFSTMTVTRTDDIEPGLIRFERSSDSGGPRVIALFPDDTGIGYQPIYPSARKQANAPVATTGTKP
jgi:hypothetical protein